LRLLRARWFRRRIAGELHRRGVQVQQLHARSRVTEFPRRGVLPTPSNTSPTQLAQLAQQEHARERHILAFAQCLRTHGVPAFPDPTSRGQLTREMLGADGVDLHASALHTAARACLGAAGGAMITAADVERALTGTPYRRASLRCSSTTAR
jgi:hypothetical protein